MIFGGLEIVAGGYLLHRHYRKKNQVNTAEDDVQKKRHHTFPGAICGKQHQQQQHQQQHHNIQHPPQPPQHHQLTLPHQKYASYAITPQPRPQLYTPQTLPHPDFHHQQHPPLLSPQQRPHPPPQTHSFTIPRRPVPQRKPHIIIQPSLQRSDSFATLSRMPIANGSRPHDVREEEPISLSPTAAGGLGGGVYSNAGYSVSTPAFGATATSPGLRYEMATAEQVEGWASYGGYAREEGEARPHYAPTVSTELGERDAPPPPYVP